MTEKALQERINKGEEKLTKLNNTLSKHLVKLQKIYKRYAEAKWLHALLPLDFFIKFDTETHYSWKDEIEFNKEVGINTICAIHNKEAVKRYASECSKHGDEAEKNVRYFLYDAEEVVSMIVNKRLEIKELEERINGYKEELRCSNSKKDAVAELFKKVPELKEFIEKSAKTQYAFLINHNNAIKEAWEKYHKLDREACELWNTGKHDEYNVKAKEAKAAKPKALVRTEEQIKNDVENWKNRESELMAERLKTEFGDIISTSLYLGADGNVNGIIQGSNKTARIDTIFAGGYNIQCLHTRLLVHEK